MPMCSEFFLPVKGQSARFLTNKPEIYLESINSEEKLPLSRHHTEPKTVGKCNRQEPTVFKDEDTFA